MARRTRPLRIVTNPGSNLSAAAIERFSVVMAPQHIVVDGAQHDTRRGFSRDEVDRWIAVAKQHPYVIGTTAAAFVELLRALPAEPHDIIGVHTSRQIISTYTAFGSAAKTWLTGHADWNIRSIDTGMTDLGAGLQLLMVAQAVERGLSLDEIDRMMPAISARASLRVIPESLDYAVKGGRTGLLKAFLADLLDVTPVLGFSGGEYGVIGRVSRKAEREKAIVEGLFERVPRGSEVWAAVVHTGAPDRVAKMTELLHDSYRVKVFVAREFTSSIYLHMGSGAIGAAVFDTAAHPIDLGRPDAI